MTSTTSKLKEVHTNLWGPHILPSQFGSVYAEILICEQTQKTWTLYLQGKDNFVDVFQVWLPQVKSESRCSMKILKIDNSREFISKKLCLFCEKQGIAIKYAISYIHEENGLAKRRWQTIVTIKNVILIDSRLPNRFWAKVMETANHLWNKLLIRSKSHGKVVSKECWISC